MSENLRIDPDGVSDSGMCECYGRSSRTVWGFVRSNGAATAVYYVHWTLGHVHDNGAIFDLIIGAWGDGTNAAQRQAVRLDYRLLPNGPGFMVVDADQSPVASGGLAGRALTRAEVIGKPIAKITFEIADAVLLQDKRIAELSLR